MKATDYPFTEIIDGRKQFIIPVFQRDYRWTEDQCNQLWLDILRVADDPRGSMHFFGSVVHISTEDSHPGFTRWLLIDGQQRLTSIMLIVIALRDHMTETGWAGGEDGPTLGQLESYFLKNLQEVGDRIPKLVLRRHDQKTLLALLDRQDVPADFSVPIRDNYDFFRERVAEADPATIYRGITRLTVVNVTLNPSTDDPQLIFESLNSTGMDLSQSDLIRNFILMRLPEHEQTRLYETYWSKIETVFRGSERTFDTFVRDYMALEMQARRQEKADQIYLAFRREYGSIGSDIGTLEQLLKRLLRFARYHAAFSLDADTETALREPLARLRRLADVPATLVMRLFDCYDLGTLRLDEFIEGLGLVESYLFRRAIGGEQTRAYWQFFASLAYAIDSDRPFESLLVGLARQRDAYRFPGDEEFREALEEGDIYRKRVCFYLLDRLENHDSKEPSDTSKYTIEHIMPQNENLAPEWQRMLGDDWRDVQRRWLHRLGNLTLTGYNSKYSDRPFEEKKTMEKGFEESAVRLNKYVREQAVWTEEKMEERGKLLAEQALKIWPYVVVDQALVVAAESRDLRKRAERRDVTKVNMTDVARMLFELLSKAVEEFDGEIIELAEQKSVSYHTPAYFMEVIPRKAGITLLLAPDFNEIDDPTGIAQDASEWRYFLNAAHGGGVTMTLSTPEDVAKAIPIVRQAHTLALT